ncbi:aldehyde dehydrogenase, partial [Pseudomonas sp. ATCC 13867]
MSFPLPPYADLDLQPLAGHWRHGASPRQLEVRDPYTDQCLLSLPLATRADLDQACQAARAAQV